MGCEFMSRACVDDNLEVASIDCITESNLPMDGDNMPIGAILKKGALCIDENALMVDVLENFSRLGVESAPVVDGEARYLGYIYRSRAGSQGPSSSSFTMEHSSPPHRLPIYAKDAVICTAPILESKSIHSAILQLTKMHVRELPVVSRDGALLAVLEDLDAVRWLTRSRRLHATGSVH